MKAKLTSVLTPLLDAGITDEQRASQHFHASGLRDCGRRQVLGLLGYKEARITKPQWQRAAEMGNRIHDYVTDICRAQGILEAAEQPIEVDPEYFVSGRVDAILNRAGNRRVLEIKSMNSAKYSMFTPGDSKWEAGHAQLQWYLFTLEIDGGFLLAINRDNLAWKEYSVAVDDSCILALRARMKRLREYLDRGTPPPPERSKQNCYFCGFKGTQQCPEEEKEWL